MSESAANWQTDRLVEFLSRGSSYADRPNHVDVIETHISWVFLTDHYAYKLKKPVKFDFLDFSSRQRRHEACQNELRLNRRLAPDVYITVLPITEDSNGRLQLDRSGREVDWVVQMRRLPSERALDHLIQADCIATSDVDAIARFLSDFYRGLPAIPTRGDDYRKALERHIRANQKALLPALENQRMLVRRLHSAQLRYLCSQRSAFDDRAASGRIVDGHGDLRPEHIYLVDTPAVIDCIEFSDELRSVDVADELSFLAMECERLGNPNVGESILSTYQKRCADRIPARLSWFYRSYRACVRAKVAVLQAQQHPNGKAVLESLTAQYLGLAESYASSLGPPSLLVIFGLMGSGKSTLANALANAFDIDVFSTDQIRRSRFGASPSPAEYGVGLYRAETREHVYKEMFRHASAVLESRQSAIMDGTFLSRRLRERANSLARQHGALTLRVLCECPRETALARIAARQKAGGTESEARGDLYDQQVNEFQPPTGDEQAIHVDTTAELSEQKRAVFDVLGSRLFSNA